MGRRSFHGAVVTLADACEADYLVVVKCKRCETSKQMHPWNLIAPHKRLATAPLNAMLPGFYCRTCRSRVSVTITCTHKRSGEF
jgi:formate dehydrogenase maturation protein FdhE